MKSFANSSTFEDSSIIFNWYNSGTDMERKALWLEWFSIAQEKNSTVRRETEVSFK